MTKKRSKKSVREATKEAYLMMPERFNVNNLIAWVRGLVGRPHLHDGTILRRLRELRSDQICFYQVVDPESGEYSKHIIA